MQRPNLATLIYSQGRLEAYLPENKVFAFERPSMELWQDRSIPPPPSSVKQTVYDCSDVKGVHGIDTEMPTHGGYHYSSTAVEWYRLLQAMKKHAKTGVFVPDVSLDDGMRAVQVGLQASSAIVNDLSLLSRCRHFFQTLACGLFYVVPMRCRNEREVLGHVR